MVEANTKLYDLSLKTPAGHLDMKTCQNDSITRVNIKPEWELDIAGKLIKIKEKKE